MPLCSSLFYLLSLLLVVVYFIVYFMSGVLLPPLVQRTLLSFRGLVWPGQVAGRPVGMSPSEWDSVDTIFTKSSGLLDGLGVV